MNFFGYSLAWVLNTLIRGYQLIISPFVPGCCRFQPTCSNYALQAINQYGSLQGIFLAWKRLFRCHPWGGVGYDPVPKRTSYWQQLKYVNQDDLMPK